ncbi:MAG TPA: lipopolysaccharide assembly protein LapA domain-containing protein [Acidimicrobiia bacterium]|nr:lipopolysaccharide assembly protein LapA domain-containing protein [Acidimicrobiia bacterium]
MTDHDDREVNASPVEPEEATTQERRSYEEPQVEVPWRLALFLALTVVIVVFAVQNTHDVEIHFLGFDWQLPLVIIILISVVIAVILDEVLGGIIRRRRRRRQWERQELRRLRSDE